MGIDLIRTPFTVQPSVSGNLPMMPSSDVHPETGVAAPLPLLLLIVSPAALKEATPLGGSHLLQALAEQLLEQLGCCYAEEKAGPIELAPTGAVRPLSWKCHLQTKYYTADIQAIMVQQVESTQAQMKELQLQEPPEAVIFICSSNEQQQLNGARRALAKYYEQDNEPKAFIEPLLFMKENFVMQQHQHEKEEQQDGVEYSNNGGCNDWWARCVPLKFIVSLHCDPNACCCCCSKSSTNSCCASVASNNEVDTVVWNIGDVFLEGLEVCLVSRGKPVHDDVAPVPEDGVTAAFAVAQQRHRLRKLADSLHYHMWPGLSRLSTNNSGNKGTNNSTTNRDRRSAANTRTCSTDSDAANVTEEGQNSQRAAPQCGRGESDGSQAKNKDVGCFVANDAEAFDALAAAMLDLKQRGTMASPKTRRRTAMRLAAQLAALTMCDKE